MREVRGLEKERRAPGLLAEAVGASYYSLTKRLTSHKKTGCSGRGDNVWGKIMNSV